MIAIVRDGSGAEVAWLGSWPGLAYRREEGGRRK